MCYFLSTSPGQRFLSVLYPQCLELSRISEAIRGRKEGRKVRREGGRKEVNPNKDPIGGICLHSIPSYVTLIRNQPSLKI